ncbi:hypothetical protein BDY24DRAFT_402585 [Mrakia frigida]|uniref:putative tRNA acetyltransferase n=1 Tax=Mrakia frigida TaxID=29902 RepID=UPI003FCC1E04
MSRRPSSKKPQYRSDGSFVSKSGSGGDVTGPGLWVTGVRGKERICVAETYEVLEALVEELYPGAQEEYRKMKDAWRTAQQQTEGGKEAEREAENDDDEEEDIEKQVAKELAGLATARKGRTKKLANLIVNHQTNIDCIMWFSLLPPIDPTAITLHLLNKIKSTGFSGLRYVQRLTPASYSCPATLEDIVTLVQTKLYPPVFNQGRAVRFKVLHHSVHNASLDRDVLIRTLATSVPQDQGHFVDLSDNAEVIISVRLLRNVASFSLLPGKEYVDLLKFNVPLLTAEVRVQNSNEKAEGEGGESSSRAGAAVSAKMEAKEAVVGM